MHFNSPFLFRGNTNFLDGADMHCVTSLLKWFFRSCPTPLFTFDAHTSFVTALTAPTDDARQQRFIELLRGLPQASFKTICVRKSVFHGHVFFFFLNYVRFVFC